MVAASPSIGHETSHAPGQGLFRRALVSGFRRVMRVYFSDVEETGPAPAPSTGGRIFVANHTNGLVDPILVITQAACTVSPVAKSTLWKIPGLSWLLDAVDAVPIVRRRDDPTKGEGSNDAVFDRVASSLAGGHNILIFPEGTSHNEPHLIALKSGAARMLARAREQGGAGLTFQAVALEFDERESFRSRCLLVYGPVRRVDELAGSHPQNGAPSEAATATDLVAEITRVMQEDLSELLVEGATWPERVLIARVAEMLANDGGDRSLEGWNAIGRQVEAASKALRGAGEAKVAEIAEAVGRYYELLAEEGLADEQLVSDEAGDGAAFGRTALLLAIAPLAAAGALLYQIPYRLPRFVARVKHTDADEVSTIKLGVGLLVYPAWAAALVGGGFALLPAPAAVGFGIVALASPFAALAWLDEVPRIRRSLRMRSRGARREALREARAEAMRRIQATRDALGLG